MAYRGNGLIHFFCFKLKLMTESEYPIIYDR